MGNVNHCRVQRFMLNFAAYIATLSGAVAFTHLWTITDDVLEATEQSQFSMICRSGLMFLMLVYILVWLGVVNHVYRKYNIEQAIHQSLKQGVVYREALFKDWEWRNHIVFILAVVLVAWALGYRSYSTAQGEIMMTSISLAIFFIGVIMLIILSISARRQQREHRRFSEQRIPLWTYESTLNGDKNRNIYWDTIATASKKYWRES